MIDATAFCYRAFYALKGLATSYGQPTNAVYGFINILNKIIKSDKPEYLAACFDVSRDTFRSKKFAEYKIQRPPMPDGLSSQIPLIKELVSAYGIKILEKEGFEADDIIATFARKAKENGMKVTVVSSDKDMLQLVDKTIVVFSPYKDSGVTYDAEKVRERFGITAGQIPDIIALMGDDVDNIPGVRGIGEKTAVELIKNSGSLDKLLLNLEDLKPEKIKNALENSIDMIRLNKELVLLRDDVEIDFNLEELKISAPDYDSLFRLFKRLEFKKMLKELPVAADKQATVEIPALEDKDLGEEFSSSEELILYLNSQKKIVFCAKEKIFSLENFGPNIKRILSDPGIKKIGHDLKRTKVYLAQNGIILNGLSFDIMVASYLANPSKSEYGLIDIALEYLDEAVTLEALDDRKALDLILGLKPKLEKLLSEHSLIKLFLDTEMPLVEVLAEMELTGIRIDQKALKKLSGELQERLIKLIEEIYIKSGTQFNINSPKQLREVLFEKLKLPVARKTKTGPSTDEEVLRGLAKIHELPAYLLEYRQLMKLKNTYVDALPELINSATNRIHASFNQTATETGRLSSSNPNLQNLPIKTDIGSRIRQAVISLSEDSYLVSCDYSQIELRILAHISKDDTLIDAFKHNEDVHRATAALIFNAQEKDVTDQMRETAKRVNFGIIYGLTPFGLSRDLNIPIDEAQVFIDAYFIKYPKVKDYIEEQIKRAEKDGFVTTILGRRRYIPEMNNKNQGIRQFAQRQAVNTPIQGSASDLIKLAMVQIHRQIEERQLKSRMLIQVHDELVFDVAGKELNDFVALVKDKMENVLKLAVPIRVDIKKGKNWLQMEVVR